MEVLVLEDDDVRFYCMQKALQRHLDQKIQRWDNSAGFIAALAAFMGNDCILSLDLNLLGQTLDGSYDSGKYVVEALLKREPFCEVIIHSSSEADAEATMDSLRVKGWTVHSCPLGCDRAVTSWASLVATCMAQANWKDSGVRS